MSKRLLVAVWCLLIGGGLALGLLWLYNRPDDGAVVTERELAKVYEEHFGRTSPQKVAPLPVLDPSRPVRLAIGGLGFPNEAQNRELGDLLVVDLTHAKGLELVERQSLDRVLTELGMRLTGLVRAKEAVQIGKLLRADWFLLGTSATIRGSNSIVVRVVDARTGIMRTGASFNRDQPTPRLAAELAAFVLLCRQDASEPLPRIYLAIGAFEDLSINNRQAELPEQLRGFLTAAYQRTRVTLLEREFVDTLLREVRLDLAGLTDERLTNASTPMQSAFWMVTGSYQSYETTNLQVELDLEVARMFGTAKHVPLRGQAGEPINQAIKRAVDQVMNQNTAAIFPTRQSEVRIQMARGKDLAGMSGTWGGLDLVYSEIAFGTVLDQQKAARTKRNIEEALRAFQTVLLFEPTNREAKLYLAACLRNNTIQRLDEAREYYREVIEEPVQDKWSEVAKKALSASFGWGNPQEKARWFASVARETTNPSAGDFYRREMEAAEGEVLLKSTGPKAQELAEARLWGSITNALLGDVSGHMGVEDFVKTFGSNQVAAAQRLVELYPEFKSRAPYLAPYLLAAVVAAQVDTNGPVVVEFQQMLENLVAHPDQVFRPDRFWWHILPNLYDWSWQHNHYRMAATLLEGKVRAAAIYTLAASYTNHVGEIEISNRDRIRLAYAYLGTEEWEKALRVFETFSNQPFSVFEDGPWGRAGRLVFTGQEVDYCRGKLGLPARRKGREFSMGKPVLQLCTHPTFTTDEDGLWIGLEGQLLHLDFDLKTNLILSVPMDNPAPITAICLTSSNIWIGTDGEGLYSFDKASGQFRRFKEKDGLLMDKVASLYRSPDALWVGYGRSVREIELKSAGGLGRIDLRTLKITSFMPSVFEGPEARAGSVLRAATGTPPRDSVLGVVEGAVGEIWLLADGPTPKLCRFHAGENAWDAGVIQACSSLARDSEHLFLGRCWNYFGEEKAGPLGVSILDLGNKDGKWRDIKGADGLPPGRVSAMVLDSGRLWVGGFGYVALVDLLENEVRTTAYVQAESVDRIQIGGGYIWAQYNCHLHRALLSQLQ